MRPLLATCMHGLGDAVYQRPFLRAQSEVRQVYASTPWPEIYSDLPNVHPVRVASRYRTQTKNLTRLAAFPWEQPPRDCDRAQFTYSLQKPGTICQEIERHVGLAGRPFVFDLPDFGTPPLAPPYAVIRPVSVRREWMNTARNPDPAYIAEAARLLRAAGYTVACVADIAAAETLVGEMPEADVYWTAGELEQPALFALIQHASVVVGGVGWIVPTCLAYRTPAVIVCGGLGQHNAPGRMIDPRMDGSRVRFLLPDPYCMCRAPRHECRKVIPDFAQRFEAALLEVTGQQLVEAAA
jgi:hypothetical protein